MLIELFDRLLNASPNLGLLNICVLEILFLSLVYCMMWKLSHTQPFKVVIAYLKQELRPQQEKRSDRS
ncbi:hypothetical protein GGD50_000323 [Rhizobium paranaense]|uniref:Uncharacterized protein n=3 Tax=Rhizobium TaxID=379 RepID=A0A7W8XLS5_9HYPH|nr:hypothetical protein [Rhizobium paranaense]PST63827.1 hypothetical protein C9E91_05615 [Rhizobium sp. SEMIA4064]